MRERKWLLIATAGLVSGLLSMAPIVLAKDRNATFVAIDFNGAVSTQPLGINSAGEIVGRYQDTLTGPTHGFLRNGFGQFTPIDFQGADFTVAAGINSRGDIVGQYRLQGENMNERHGFLRSRDGTFITINAPGAYFTNALGINRRGEIVGRFCTGVPPSSNMACQGNPHHGFLLSRNAFTTIDFPGTVDVPNFAGPLRTDAWDINNRGEIVGGYQDTNSKSHVYRLREGQFTAIDFPDALDTAPDAGKGGINSRGDIVSSYCVLKDPTGKCSYGHAFLLSHGEFTTTMDFPATPMGSPGGHVTFNFGINARGDIVGTYNDASGTAHGFLLKLEDRDEDED